MAKIPEIDNSSINLLGGGTRIKGEIVSNGDFRIDGTLQGNISIKGKLVLGASGKIEGNITCQNADISGIVVGNAKIGDLLILQNSSKITGDIHIGKLSIEPGAVFEGKCMMGEQKQNTNIVLQSENISVAPPLNQNADIALQSENTSTAPLNQQVHVKSDTREMQKHKNEKRR